jgi:hypothetical protein
MRRFLGGNEKGWAVLGEPSGSFYGVRFADGPYLEAIFSPRPRPEPVDTSYKPGKEEQKGIDPNLSKMGNLLTSREVTPEKGYNLMTRWRELNFN